MIWCFRRGGSLDAASPDGPARGVLHGGYRTNQRVPAVNVARAVSAGRKCGGFDAVNTPRCDCGHFARRGLQTQGEGRAAVSLRDSIKRPIVLLAVFLWAFGAQGETYTVPLLVPAGGSAESHGVLRILNGTAETGTVAVYAIDDSGARSGPATFTLNALAAAEFSAVDLQSGNAELGLTGGIGTDVGDTRLVI